MEHLDGNAAPGERGEPGREGRSGRRREEVRGLEPRDRDQDDAFGPARQAVGGRQRGLVTRGSRESTRATRAARGDGKPDQRSGAHRRPPAPADHASAHRDVR